MLRRLTTLFILLPIGVVLIMLAVSNRQPVTLSVPPHIGNKPMFSVEVPLFFVAFGALIIGLILGGVATWFTQSKHRKIARQRKVEANRWHVEADKEKERAESLAQKVADAEGKPRELGLPSPANAS